MPVFDSLILDERIELLGGGAVSVLPECAGVVFHLAPGWSAGMPAPDIDLLATTLGDGEVPIGYRSSNRTLSLPIVIKAPPVSSTVTAAQARQLMIAGLEMLMQSANQPMFTLRLTRASSGLPTLYDCYRAAQADRTYSMPVEITAGVVQVTINFSASPYGRNDTPVVVDFPASLAGITAPPSPVIIDNYGSVSGTNWSASTYGPTGSSAVWSPPGGNPTGAGISASYSVTGLSFNITGLNSLTMWAGFGTGFSAYYYTWGRLGGRVTFSFTLTDNAAHVLKVSRTFKVQGGSNMVNGPIWTKIRVPIPVSGTFNYANLTAYSVTITNRGTNDLQFTECFIDLLTATAVPTSVAVPSRGAVYDLAGINGSVRAPIGLQAQQTGTQSVTKTIKLNGNGTFIAPPGCTSVSVYAVAAGGAGASGPYQTMNPGGGGGGGGSAFNAAVAVTVGNIYNYTVGTGGVSGSSPTNGGNTSFTGDSVTVLAHGGTSAAYNSSTGGAAGATGTGGHAGGAGGAGAGGTGGGGGSSGGSAAGGFTGGAGGAGGLGGAAVTGGGKGGNGSVGNGAGSPGSQPGGGGGGGSPSAVINSNKGGNGGSGELILIYNQATAFQSLIVHRPPVTGPEMLCPFVSPNPGDPMDGTTEYPVPSLIVGANARFNGTYTVVVSPYSWHTTTARTITVTVKQYEQPGGAVYNSSVSAVITPAALPQLANDPSGTGYAIIGELTLPANEMPPDNVNAYFTVTVQSSDTADSYMDILFLDTMGSTVIIQSPTGYQNIYLDEASVIRDYGFVLGSLFDRGDAVSILDRAIITGGPMTADPFGNASLLVYSGVGAPAIEMTYFPRWMGDRMS